VVKEWENLSIAPPFAAVFWSGAWISTTPTWPKAKRAYNVIGGGEEGEKTTVRTKEEATTHVQGLDSRRSGNDKSKIVIAGRDRQSRLTSPAPWIPVLT